MTAHVAPASVEITLPRRVYLHDALTGRVISSCLAAGADRWSWIIQNIAAEFDCSPDDVACIDTEDRFDNITVDGKIVAFVEAN